MFSIKSLSIFCFVRDINLKKNCVEVHLQPYFRFQPPPPVLIFVLLGHWHKIIFVVTLFPYNVINSFAHSFLYPKPNL